MKQRPQYILEAFARAGHPVYFVDVSEQRARRANGVHIVPSLDDVPATGTIIYTHFAPVQTMLGGFEQPEIVYDILDDLSIFDEDEVGLPEERRVRHHHPDVMDDAAVVIASAPRLVDEHAPERADILFVENGVDTRRFGSPGPVPESLATLAGPVVGYHGMVARWFDFDLFGEAAAAMPEVTFAIVGPVDERCMSDANQLAEHTNVHFLGEMSSDQMPGVVAGFDVGVVPFVVDDLTRAVSPLKMYEYLAGGKPVVATPLPVCESHPLVATAPDRDGFVAALHAAIASSQTPELEAERKDAAAKADWDVRMKPLLNRMDELGARRVAQ